jgi:hypothetical protein
MWRSAPPITRLARSFAGEAAPKERVRVAFARLKIPLRAFYLCVIQSEAKNPGSDLPLARRERIEGEGPCSASVFLRATQDSAPRISILVSF